MNFWRKLTKPLFVIAPMANVTDAVFRKLFATYGKPDVMWTEFVSADGLCSSNGKKVLLRDLEYSPKERPIVAQLFTGHPEAMREAAALVARLGFDGLDINMGCPDRAVEKQGGGSALIKDPMNAIAVLNAAREGWVIEKGKKNVVIPVTIKTRLGYNAVDWKWLELLLKQHVPVLTIHLRTRKEMSDVPAHWEIMPEIVKLRDSIQADITREDRTIIIGNGDVASMDEAQNKVDQSGCDGVMIGRGIFGKPWFFERASSNHPKEKSPKERLSIMLEHAKLFEKTFGGKKRHKSFAVMKKHFKAYVSGWDGAKELRAQLMAVDTYPEVEKIVKTHLKKL